MSLRTTSTLRQAQGERLAGATRGVSSWNSNYNEIELEHRYEYYASGTLKRAEIIETEDDPKVMCFDEQGGMAD